MGQNNMKSLGITTYFVDFPIC